MKYLKIFSNHSDYNDYINGQNVAYPNISMCIEENEIHLNDAGEVIDPDINNDNI